MSYGKLLDKKIGIFLNNNIRRGFNLLLYLLYIQKISPYLFLDIAWFNPEFD